MFIFYRFKNKNLWDILPMPCFSPLIRVQVCTGRGLRLTTPHWWQRSVMSSPSVSSSPWASRERPCPLVAASPASIQGWVCACALLLLTANRELSASPQRGGKPGLSPTLLAIPFLSPSSPSHHPLGAENSRLSLISCPLMPTATINFMDSVSQE